MHEDPFLHDDGESAAVEFEQAIALLGGDRGDYASVVQVFLDEVPTMLASLSQAPAAGPSRMIAVAHELANSFGIVGATGAERRARRAEQALRDGLTPQLGELGATLAGDVAGVARLLQSFLADGEAGSGA